MSAVDEVIPALQLPSFSGLTTSHHVAAAAPRASAALVSRQQWERRYKIRLRTNDTAIVLIACILASIASLLVTAPQVLAQDPGVLVRVPLCTALFWLVSLSLFNTRQPSIMGTGATEYTRVAHATGLAFGALAIVFVLFGWQGIRTQLFYALPFGMVTLTASRWLWRRWLLCQRVDGRYASRTLVVGSRDDVEYAIKTLGQTGSTGYRVVGTALIDDDIDQLVVGATTYPVARGMNAVRAAVRRIACRHDPRCQPTRGRSHVHQAPRLGARRDSLRARAQQPNCGCRRPAHVFASRRGAPDAPREDPDLRGELLHPQARAGCRRFDRRAPRLRPVRGHHRDRHQGRQSRARLLPAGTSGPRRPRVLDGQVPLHASERRG